MTEQFTQELYYLLFPLYGRLFQSRSLFSRGNGKMIDLINLYAAMCLYKDICKYMDARMIDEVKHINSTRVLREYDRKRRSEYKIVYMGELIRGEEIPNDD